jgi:hypothetical protein
MEPLNAENTEMVRVYYTMANQLTYDLHLAPMLLERFCGDESDEQFLDRMEQMNLVHVTMQRIAKNKAKTEAD